MHAEDEYAMVHAGLLPSWSIGKALDLARETEHALQGSGWRDLLAQMYGNQPDHWDDALSGYERLRVIINAMTRLRICTPDGRMQFSYKGGIERYPARLRALVCRAGPQERQHDCHLRALVGNRPAGRRKTCWRWIPAACGDGALARCALRTGGFTR